MMNCYKELNRLHLKWLLIAKEHNINVVVCFLSMHQERDEATQESFKNDLHSVFTDINELMSSRLPDATVQVLGSFELFSGSRNHTMV